MNKKLERQVDAVRIWGYNEVFMGLFGGVPKIGG